MGTDLNTASKRQTTGCALGQKTDAVIKPITLDVHWCIGIQYTQNNNSFVILNVYTPFEMCENEEEYLSRLALINAFVQDNSTVQYICCG